MINILIFYIFSAFLVDTGVVYTGAPYEQTFPSISFDGDNYFIIWQDTRNYPNSPIWYDLYGTRVSRDGEVLDPGGGIFISKMDKNDFEDQCDIAFNGENHLAVWADGRNGGWLAIYAARLNKNGEVLDTQGICVHTGGWNWYPSVCAGDSNWFIVWLKSSQEGYSVYGARVRYDGTVLDPNGIPICSAATNEEWSPDVAFDGENYMVVWNKENYYGTNTYCDIYCARVSKDGVLLDPNGIVVASGANDQWMPSIAFDGQNYLIVWLDFVHPIPGIYGARVTPSGQVLDPGGFFIIPFSASIPVSRLGISYGGGVYLLAWVEEEAQWTDYNVCGIRISPNGYPIGDKFIIKENTARFWEGISVSFDGDNFMVAWSDITNNPNDIRANIFSARVTPSGTVIDTAVLVSSCANEQIYPQISFNGNEYLIIWKDMRTEINYCYWQKWCIYGALLNSQGNIIKNIPILKNGLCSSIPSITSSNKHYLCAFEVLRPAGNIDIYGLMIDFSGNVDTNYIMIANSGFRECQPSLASDGDKFLCIWHLRSGDFSKIYATLLDSIGLILDTSSITQNFTAKIDFSPIIFNNDKYFVVWEDNRNGNWDIFGARIDRNGTLIDTYGIQISTSSTDEENPSVSFGNNKYFVVWEDERNGEKDIYGARVDTQGILIDTLGIPICIREGEQKNPSICFDGSNYFVVWEDYREGNGDILGCVLDTSGTILDSFTICNSPEDENSPKVISLSTGQILVTYSCFTQTIAGKPVNCERVYCEIYPLNIKEKFEFPRISIENRSIPTLLSKNKVRVLKEKFRIYDINGRYIRKMGSGIYFIKFKKFKKIIILK